jgi:hypothetical protein
MKRHAVSKSQVFYCSFVDNDQRWPSFGRRSAKKAKSYIKSSSFSRSGLVDQLRYEGFTPEQAEYGVSQTGL